jgi:hypothetical protein
MWHWWDHNPHTHYTSITERGSEIIGSLDSYFTNYREKLMKFCSGKTVMPSGATPQK